MLSSFAIIILTALIHTSFQLSVSVFTHLSGHAIGAKIAHAKVLRLESSFILGVFVMTMLMLTFTAFTFQHLFITSAPPLMWSVACGLLLGLGVAVWVFYYRRGNGTMLWLPRGVARHLSERSKATTHSAEAFNLGLGSVAGELLFIFVPIVIASLALIQLEPIWQLAGIAVYTFISLLSLIVVYILVGSGHKLSQIQKWREHNKRFLQFAAGGGLLILGFYVYVDQVIATTVLAYGGA
jgi:hypothetical protein